MGRFVSVALGLDVGGTKIGGGVVAGDGTLVATSRRDCPARDPTATAADLARAAL